MLKRVNEVEMPHVNEWLFPKLTVILISGKAGVGKTTAANYMLSYLKKNITNYVHLTHFALGVKEVAYKMGWNGKKDVKGRKLLQDVGNVGRNYNDTVWVSYMLKDIYETIPEELLDLIIVDDWRFPNEANYFLERKNQYNTFTVNIKSIPEREVLRGKKEWLDVSETSLDNYHLFDYILENYNSLEVFEYNTINVLLDITENSKKGGKP